MKNQNATSEIQVWTKNPKKEWQEPELIWLNVNSGASPGPESVNGAIS